MQEIIKKLKQKEAVVSELQKEKQDLPIATKDLESRENIGSKLNDAEKEVQMIKNILEMRE